MEGIIPEDKKDFWREMKGEAMSEMQANIEEARRFGRVEDKLRAMAGFDPEQVTVLKEFEDEFGGQFGFFEDMRREQAGRIQGRLDNFNNFTQERPKDAHFLEKAEAFRLRLEEDPGTLERLKPFAPGLEDSFKNVEVLQEQHGFSPSEARRVIAEAEGAVQKLAARVEEGGTEENPGANTARKLLAEARDHLEKARTALANEKFGEVFGQATSATHIANNGLRHLETSMFEKERTVFFEQRDDLRMQLKEIPLEKRPELREIFPMEPPKGEICLQVITPTKDPVTGKCIRYPNSCIPKGWQRVDSCPMLEEGNMMMMEQERMSGEEGHQDEGSMMEETTGTFDEQRLLEQQRLLYEQQSPEDTRRIEEEQTDFFKIPFINL